MKIGLILSHIKTNYRGRVESIEDLGDGIALVKMMDGRQFEATIKDGKVNSREVQYASC